MTSQIETGLYVLLLSTFLGFEVIRRVPKLLHTPLMALTNAISGVALVGSLVVAGRGRPGWAVALGAAAVTTSAVNVIGGFLITDRMLGMFRRREPAAPEPRGASMAATSPPASPHSWFRALPLVGTACVAVGAMLAIRAGGAHGATSAFVTSLYLVAAAAFVLGLRWLTDPRTARRGVAVAEAGMLLAIVGTLTKWEIVSFGWIGVALALGTAIGVFIARWTPMTAVPQMIALSHAFGALAAALVGTAEYYLRRPDITTFTMAVLVVEVVLGYLTFTGSLMAFGKLQGVLPERPLVYAGQNAVNLGVLAAALGIGVALVVNPGWAPAFPAMLLLALAFGVLLIVPIGGSDMPTVISLMNSYAGLAGAAMGFVLHNELLIVAGALTGASGALLSMIMCRAMNRSFANVLFGAFGAVSTGSTGSAPAKAVKTAAVDEVGMLLDASTSVIVVPGYGMAAAQAQHKVAELADVLGTHGVDVRFAIHPVAGRMPGHMNVLLAEANVPYDRLFDMDEINDDFPQTDVVLVVGANDVVNPAARHDTASPIYGMPILDADRARCVVVIKRSLRSGFAGVDNELFYGDTTLMLFGDAKQVAADLIEEVTKLGGEIKLAA